jgi:uncharacterized phage protein (TIGR02220 family)/predicted phage replisome organizer
MKKYYWLKLKDDFFQQKTIKKLRKIAGGDTFTIIYLKMMLVAIKSEGRILHEGIETNFHEELALDLDEDEENVRLTINYLLNHGLMEESLNEFYIPESVQNTGKESESAERVRRHREKSLQCNIAVTASNDKVTESNDNVTACNTEKEIEKEIENKSKRKEKEFSRDSNDILDYLNQVSGSNYRMIKTNLKLIESLLQQGYTKADFFTVINKKTEEWRGTEMQQYLRPQTLFGSKFDSYLNQPMIKVKTAYEKQTDKLKELFDKFGGEENDKARISESIFDV